MSDEQFSQLLAVLQDIAKNVSLLTDQTFEQLKELPSEIAEAISRTRRS